MIRAAVLALMALTAAPAMAIQPPAQRPLVRPRPVVAQAPAALAALPAHPKQLYVTGKNNERVPVTVRRLTREEAVAHSRDLAADPRGGTVPGQTSGWVRDYGFGAKDIVAYGLETGAGANKRFLGFLVTPSEHEGKVEFVHADSRAGVKGVGSLLMAHQIRRAYEAKTPYLVLEATASARPFYEKLGFSAMGSNFKHPGNTDMKLDREKMPALLEAIYRDFGRN
jgi:ribosomal protein S18 acetylase RimI-like enzyme